MDCDTELDREAACADWPLASSSPREVTITLLGLSCVALDEEFALWLVEFDWLTLWDWFERRSPDWLSLWLVELALTEDALERASFRCVWLRPVPPF